MDNDQCLDPNPRKRCTHSNWLVFSGYIHMYHHALLSRLQLVWPFRFLRYCIVRRMYSLPFWQTWQLGIKGRLDLLVTAQLEVKDAQALLNSLRLL